MYQSKFKPFSSYQLIKTDHITNLTCFCACIVSTVYLIHPTISVELPSDCNTFFAYNL